MPFGPDVGEYLSWIYHGGGLELWRDLYAEHDVYLCHPSEPLNIQGKSDEEIVADYGPYERSADDPMLAEILGRQA